MLNVFLFIIQVALLNVFFRYFLMHPARNFKNSLRHLVRTFIYFWRHPVYVLNISKGPLYKYNWIFMTWIWIIWLYLPGAPWNQCTPVVNLKGEWELYMGVSSEPSGLSPSVSSNFRWSHIHQSLKQSSSEPLFFIFLTNL